MVGLPRKKMTNYFKGSGTIKLKTLRDHPHITLPRTPPFTRFLSIDS